MSAEQDGDIAIARELATVGVPIFVARPALDACGEWDPHGGHHHTGYWLPPGWQQTVADPAALDRWRPSMAVCAVGGHRVDFLDQDPAKGGQQSADGLKSAGLWPNVFGRQSTPSGGFHDVVNVLGVGSLDGVLPGLDVKAGRPDGVGRGFVFLAPTVKLSKVTGELRHYRWETPPNLDEIDPGDNSGEAMAAFAAHARGKAEPIADLPHAAWDAMAPGQRERVRDYLDAAVRSEIAEFKEVATWPEGDRDDHGRGWQKRVADLCLRIGQLARADWTDWTPDDARQRVLSIVPSTIAVAVGIDGTWRAQWHRREPAVFPRNLAEATVFDVGPTSTAATAEPTTSLPDQPDQRAQVMDRFPRLDLTALLAATRPPREWVIDTLVPAGASVALVAPAGTGKSLLLLAAMIAVARGDKLFAGLAITPRRVLLVDMENTEDDLADRLKALGITARDAADLDQLVTIHLPPLAPLDTSIGGLELAAILDAYDLAPGDVVVLDSLQRVIDGAENDSDTMRAYYRNTALMLKRRGLTVVRTDNTGKDAERGARGTSGKRDDVDIELILTADAQRAGRLYLKPGKVRLPGIQRITIQRDLDDDGRLTYTSAGDPFRAAVNDAIALLDRLQVPPETGQRPAAEAIRRAEHKVTREALRVAISDRRRLALGAPNPLGAPPDRTDLDGCADDQRRTDGAPVENTDSERERCAEPQRRRVRAPEPDAPAGGAPPFPFSKERRTRAHEIEHSVDPSGEVAS